MGRGLDCDVKLSDKLLSKVHSHIKVNRDEEDIQWELLDGNGDEKSTNGTWIYINEDSRMFSGMTFKNNSSIFRVEVIPPK